ncbi:anthranilate synthase [Nocardioides sp. Root1257]|uniref:anthranilate synthase component II n=1 Tax=unclassified Nocardioides TaxID=2615069 RepID=UPI0006F68359|nr:MULTISPECIES: aminodeoxychorismate/anthranilate synthase component II [unclassified Nocardioides]KQW45952.1 anthranilate synthase [Nocardioides sp. Root1257]KRC43216.1 anthranilate synthase [Nocardioides sp. Root224]
MTERVGVRDSRVLVVDHYDSYTWNLVHRVGQATRRHPDVVQHDQVSAREVLAGAFTHIILSPGPGRPTDPEDFSVGREVVRRAQVPVLGVCLGMQGIATALGGVVAQVEPAHGLVSRVRHGEHPMFSGIPAVFDAVRYHSLAVLDLPDVLQPTAWCGPAGSPTVMAIAHRTRPVWGVQYHPESILTEHGDRFVSNFLGLR